MLLGAKLTIRNILEGKLQIIISAPPEYNERFKELAKSGSKSASQLFRDWVDEKYAKFQKQQKERA